MYCRSKFVVQSQLNIYYLSSISLIAAFISSSKNYFIKAAFHIMADCKPKAKSFAGNQWLNSKNLCFTDHFLKHGLLQWSINSLNVKRRVYFNTSNSDLILTINASQITVLSFILSIFPSVREMFRLLLK